MPDWHTLPTAEIERQAANIAPGAWAVDRDRPLATLLGSCVAVCLYDRVARVGGMNHFMLPEMRLRKDNADVDSVLSGSYAMEVLLNDLMAQGALRHRIEAKAFGGGTIISTLSTSAIGRKNADFARDWLAREKIPMVAHDFLGPWSRKVLFVPATGDAWCKRLTSTLVNASDLAREEAAYAASLRKRPASPKVELF